jgi:hypothetical protein
MPTVKSLSRILVSAALLITMNARSHESPLPAEKLAESELLTLHKEDRRAHFDHDVKSLIAHVAPQLVDVRDGHVNRMTRDDVRARFEEYFKNAQFLAWDDVEPPIIQVSPDGKMAYMIVRVRISYIETDASGKKSNQSTVGAWMSSYEKRNGQWLMTAVTSTFSGTRT